MSVLRSFLKEQARELSGTKAERMETIAEWKAALDSLIGRLECWLHDADQQKALSIERIPVTIGERRLGTMMSRGFASGSRIGGFASSRPSLPRSATFRGRDRSHGP